MVWSATCVPRSPRATHTAATTITMSGIKVMSVWTNDRTRRYSAANLECAVPDASEACLGVVFLICSLIGF